MNNVLVVQLARLGDLVQTKRLLHSLAATPNTLVHVCVDTSLVAFAKALYPFAVVIALPAHAGPAPEAVFAAAKQSFALLCATRFDAVYTLNASPLSYALARLFSPEIVRGYTCPNGQPMRHPWFALAGRWTKQRATAPLNLVDMWAHLVPNPIAPQTLNPLPRSANSKRVGIVMAGRAQRRSLPMPVLAACLEGIFKAGNGPQLVCIGSKSESPLVRRLARLLPGPMERQLVDTTGTTSLLDLYDLLPTLDCVVTPDTGTMHLAAHLGVPVQAFFLSSAWCFETGPYGQGHSVWQATTPCAPCLETAPCPHNLDCLLPFSHPSFLARLGKASIGEWPEALCGYTSTLDALGVTYAPLHGHSPRAQERASRRALLAEQCLHQFVPGVCAHTGAALYHEADWVLPQPHFLA